MIEDPLARFHYIGTTCVIERNKLIYYINRAYYTQPGRELVSYPNHDTYNDDVPRDTAWPPRESEGAHIVITQSDLMKGILSSTWIEFRLNHVNRIIFNEYVPPKRRRMSGCFAASTLMAPYES